MPNVDLVHADAPPRATDAVMNLPDRRSRMRGCLLGGAVGDALGAPVEFLKRGEIVAAHGARGITEFAPAYGRLGAITDDTQMTLFTAEGLLRAWMRWSCNGIASLPSHLLDAYQRWLQTQDLSSRTPDISGWLIAQRELHARRAPGRTCVTALQQGTALPAQNHSKGCGGVMRVAPIGLFGDDDHDGGRVFEQACEAAAITHGHVTGQLASGAFAVMIAALMQGHELDAAAARALVVLARHPQHEETSTFLHDAVALARDRSLASEVAIARLGGGWVAEEALAIALYCALRADLLEDVVILAVNHDGDSDSTGSIAGQLVGARDGEIAIPARWRAALELSDVIVRVADDLCDAGALQFAQRNDACEAFLQRYPAG